MDEYYQNFIKNNNQDDLFIYLVLLDDRLHSCIDNPCLLLIINCKTEKLYQFSINHQDCPTTIPLEIIINDLNKFTGRIFTLDKKSLIQHMLVKKLLDVNLALHLKHEKIINLNEYETAAHNFIKQNCNSYSSLNKVIPLSKHREMAFNIFKHIKKFLNSRAFNDVGYIKTNSLIIESLSELEMNGIFVDAIKFNKHFKTKTYNGFVYSQYNIYTSTLRPSNRFGGINYAALNKDDGCRECFISRFNNNGKIMLIDYAAFHPHIIAELTNFKLPLDVYEYLAKLFFNKTIVDDEDVKNAKALTFKQLYGGVEKQYSHIQFFYNLKGFINDYWTSFNKDGYVITPIFNRRIIKDQIQDANPNKLFNYILQATETEIAVPVLGEVNAYLRNKKSKAVLYTYDSILFDVHNDELDAIRNDVIKIMSIDNKYPVKCYVGNSYADLQLIF